VSFVSVTPQTVAAAADKLESIGSALSAANAVAAVPTTGMTAMAADDVSVAVQSMLATYAQGYQALGAQAAAFHSWFAQAVSGGAVAYAEVELASARQMLSAVPAGIAQAVGADAAVARGDLVDAVNAPARAVLGRPLIGTGAGASQAAVATAAPATTTAPVASVKGSSLAARTPAVTGTSGTGGSSSPLPEVDVNTPFGPIELTLYQSVVSNGTTYVSGSVSLPPLLVTAVDAMGPQIAASAALHADMAMFNAAVQTGNPVAAIDAVIHAPGAVVNGYLYGQTSITETLPVPSGYLSAYATVPLGGILSPDRPLTVTLEPSTGSPIVVTLTGTEFGGLANALS